MQFKTNDLILRTVTENDIKEIARMWEYPHETTIDKAYEALKYMEDTHSKNRQKSICHLCLGVFQKKEPNVIIGWCGLDGEAEIKDMVLAPHIRVNSLFCSSINLVPFLLCQSIGMPPNIIIFFW